MKMAETEVAPYLHGRGFPDPTTTYHVRNLYQASLYPLTYLKQNVNIKLSFAALISYSILILNVHFD